MVVLFKAIARYIAKHPGITNEQLHQALRLGKYSSKAFVSHFLANTSLVKEKDTKRTKSQYYPTKKLKNDTDHEDDDLIAVIHAELDAMVEEIRAIAMEHILAGNATCAADIAKHMNLYETMNGNHKGWIVWEPLTANAFEWGFVGKKYASMSDVEKKYVRRPDGRKVYYIPLV